MPATTLITTQQFSRLIGLPSTPAIIDVRIDDDYRADPRLVPGSLRRDYRTIASWASDYRSKSVVVVCQRGQKLSEGTAAWLRHEGIDAQTLEGAVSKPGRRPVSRWCAPTRSQRATRGDALFGSRARAPRSIALPVPG